jgi:glycosyltransferase involved in cell wall biosynthesis
MQRLSRNFFGACKYFLTFPGEVLSLYRLIMKEDVDIVHCNSARQLKGVVAGWLARKKVIWHLQDTYSPSTIKAIFYMMAPLVDHFIAAGERVRQYYLRRFPFNRKRVNIIQAPVDTAFFDTSLVQPDARMAAFPGLKIVSVGNINSVKGYEYFIEAASYLRGINGPVSFWIVGQPLESQRHYCENLKRMAQELEVANLNFYGPSNNVRSVLKAADVYVCSSIAEASPISVWEAMAMEKAIVSTNVGDIGRFIENGESGFIVPVGDPKALAEKIRALVENPDLRSVFGRKSRDVTQRKLDLEVSVQDHIQVYRKCLDLL